MPEDEVREQIADVIDQFNDLEMRIGLILSKCITPTTSDYGFLREADATQHYSQLRCQSTAR